MDRYVYVFLALFKFNAVNPNLVRNKQTCLVNTECSKKYNFTITPQYLKNEKSTFYCSYSFLAFAR